MSEFVMVKREILERCERELSVGVGPAPKNRAEELRAALAHEAGHVEEPLGMVDLSELRDYHVQAVSNLKSYADDAGLRDSDFKHYTKRAEFHSAMVELIDKVKELNQ